MKTYIKLDLVTYNCFLNFSFSFKDKLKGLIILDNQNLNFGKHKINISESFKKFYSDTLDENKNILSKIWMNYFNNYRVLWVVFELEKEEFLKIKNHEFVMQDIYWASNKNIPLENFLSSTFQIFQEENIPNEIEKIKTWIENIRKNKFGLSYLNSLCFYENIILFFNYLKQCENDNTIKKIDIEDLIDISYETEIEKNILFKNFLLKTNEKNLEETLDNLQREYIELYPMLNNNERLLYLSSPIRESCYYFFQIKTFFDKTVKLTQNFFNSSNRMKLSYIINRKRKPTLDFIFSYMNSLVSNSTPINKDIFYWNFSKYNEINGFLSSVMSKMTKKLLDDFDLNYQLNPTFNIDLDEIIIDVSLKEDNSLFNNFPKLRVTCIQYIPNNPWGLQIGEFNFLSKVPELVRIHNTNFIHPNNTNRYYLIKSIIPLKQQNIPF